MGAFPTIPDPLAENSLSAAPRHAPVRPVCGVSVDTDVSFASASMSPMEPRALETIGNVEITRPGAKFLGQSETRDPRH